MCLCEKERMRDREKEGGYKAHISKYASLIYIYIYTINIIEKSKNNECQYDLD